MLKFLIAKNALVRRVEMNMNYNATRKLKKLPRDWFFINRNYNHTNQI